MDNLSLKCVDCGGTMEPGFMPELAPGVQGMTCWHPGLPEWATILGLRTGSFKIDWKQAMGVCAFRCSNCGVLKLYASPAAAGEE
jgi:hypothetical protein